MARSAVGISALWAALLASGCGLTLDYGPPDIDGGARVVDAGVLDASSVPDANVDADVDAGPSPCAGANDGEACTDASGAPRVCIGGRCVASICGDGVVNPSTGEECEPRDDLACLVGVCRYPCSSDGDCGPAPPCNELHCTDHACVLTRTGDGDGCTTDTGTMGLCSAGLCLAPLCGNGVVDGGEDCDSGATTTPGCIACHFACQGDTDCIDAFGCNGSETCERIGASGDVLGMVCVPGTPPDCGVTTACSVSSCIEGTLGAPTCVTTLLDGDGDGYVVDSSCMLGGDCDDLDAAIHPGAPEACNGLDDDCNGIADDATVEVPWCPDGDGDGFGAPAGRIESCMAPGAGYVRDCTDCWDSPDPVDGPLAALVHPRQTDFFTTPYCIDATTCSFDYDCDEVETQQSPHAIDCPLLALVRCTGSGWRGTPPACGASGTFDTCVGALVCRASPRFATQACR